MRIYNNIKPNYVKNFFSNIDDAVLGDIFIASPFFSETEVIDELNAKGYKIYLIVRLSEATFPEAIEKIIHLENVQVRFFNDHSFHSKLYITPTDCMLGSSNMTKNGLTVNSEVNIAFDRETNGELYDEMKSIFCTYWENASVFTEEKLIEYRRYFNSREIIKSNFDNKIQKIEALKTNYTSSSKVDVNLNKKSFIVQSFQREYQNFQKNMHLLKSLYIAYNRRKISEDLPIKFELDRFLSFLQTEHYYKVVDKSYKKNKVLYGEELKNNVKKYLDVWFDSKEDESDFEWNYTKNVIPEKYLAIQYSFSSPDNIDKLSLREIYNVLRNVHSFHDQYRNHCKEKDFGALFIEKVDEKKLKQTLKYLIFGKENFFVKIMNVIHNSEYKIPFIGETSAIELLGWVDASDEMYLFNSRVLHSLRFLGCDIAV